MVFIFMDLPKSYKYTGAKNYLRCSVSAYDVNKRERDITDHVPASNGYLGDAIVVDQSPPRIRSKSEYDLEKIGQKNQNEACTKLRPPILVVTKESEDKDALATETKVMGKEESKAVIAKQPDEAGNKPVVLETPDISKDAVEKEQHDDTKQTVSKQLGDQNANKKKVARERKASVAKEKDAKETKVENGKVKVDESLLSEVGRLDEYELNEAGIAYMYGSKFECCNLIVMFITGALDPGFPREGWSAIPKGGTPTYYLAKFHRKWHDNEKQRRILDGGASKILLCRSATALCDKWLYSVLAGFCPKFLMWSDGNAKRG